jgi:hypothetical protein
MAAAVLAALFAPPASAHEFWLEPTDYTPKPGETVPISIRIGQHFKGNAYPYIGAEFKRFAVIDARGERPVKGIDGDDPAVTMKFARPGLTVLSHYSTPETLTFTEWSKFEYYLNFEGLEHVFELHRKRALPQTGIVEIYSRCAKLLMGVGHARGADRLTGMPLELVAEKNPYALGKDEPLPLRLYYNGKPMAGVQIAAINKSDPDNRLRVRTDAEGRAQLKLDKPGPWLVNAVHLFAPPPGMKAHWTSFWASMTFSRP